MLAESTGMTDKNIQQRVVDTIRGGDCELLREIIESDMIPVNSELYNGQTPLGMAISLHKFPAVVELLLIVGADVTVPTYAKPINPYDKVALPKKIYPLEIAFDSKNLEIIRLVFRKGPMLRYYSGGMLKMVCAAVQLKGYDLVQSVVKLAEEQEMFQVSSVNLAEPLALAIKQKDIRMVQLLIQLGANVNRENDGFAPLVWAANNQDLRMCLLLLNQGASLDGNNLGQLGAAQTPLSQAISGGLEKAVSMLLKLGSDPNGIVSWSSSSARGLQVLCAGSSMLHFAVIKRNKSIMNNLIEAHAKIIQRDGEGNTPLHLACKHTNGKSDIVKLLLDTHRKKQAGEIVELSGEIDVQNKKGRTALMVAIQECDVHVVRLLIDAGANINICDTENKTALHIAVESDSEDITLSLLRAGCKVDGEVNCSKIRLPTYTPLQVAVRENNATLVDMLLEHRANTKVITPTKETLLHLAVLAHSEDLVKQFLELGQHVDAITKTKETPLMLAARQDNTDICRLLIDGGANLNAKDKNEETALSLSIYFGFENNARLLIANGANLNLADKRNTTPLYWSIYNCRINTLKLMLVAGVSFTKMDLYRYPKNLSVMKNKPVFNWILDKLSGIQSLQDSCRKSIRRKLVRSSKNRGISERIYCLHLPNKLRRYLLFENECLESCDSGAISDVIGDG